MAYTKHNFKSRDKLFASQLNAMDEQIAANAESVDKLSEAIADQKIALDGITLGRHTDGLVYIFIGGQPVGNGLDISGGEVVEPVYGQPVTDNAILSIAQGETLQLGVRLSEEPTQKQIITVLSDNDALTFDKTALTFTADNWEDYQFVSITCGVIEEDGTATIIMRNSDDLMTDTNITVYLTADSYNVDMTVPEGAHVLTENDFSAITAGDTFGALLKTYTGEYTNVIVPAKITYGGKEYSPVAVTPSAFQNNTTVQYVTFEEGATTSSGNAAASIGTFGENFRGCTALVGVKNFPALATCDLVYAFKGCSNLRFVDGIEKIVYCDKMQEAFMGCTSLEYVQDLSGIATNRDNSYSDASGIFRDCTSLKKVYGLPNFTNMTNAFNGCTALEEGFVPATVGTFNTAVNGSNTNSAYARFCFNGCTNLKKITVLTEVATPGLPATLNNDCVIYAVPNTTVYAELQTAIATLPTATLVPYGTESGSIIAVWGDSTSSLNNTWIDWPTRLGDKISGFSIKNQAVSGEYTTSTSARQGGNALKVGAFTIPSTTDAVTVRLMTEDGHTFGMNPVFSAGGNFNPCTINGVRGTITNAGNGAYNFTRMTDGEVVNVAEGTAVVSDADTTLNSAEIMIINLGCNSGWDENANVLLNQVQLMVDHFIAHGGEKYIICGQSGGKHLRTEEMRAITFEYEGKAAAAFGEHWLNLREYLIANGLTENGLTASALDTERIALGQVPASLLGGGTTTNIKMYDGTNVTDDVHPNMYGAISIANAFYNKGAALGYWT